jgi:hypothetical protein
MMNPLMVIAIIGFGSMVVYLLLAKPSRLRRLLHRHGQPPWQRGKAPDYIHQLLLYKQQIQQAEAERERIVAEHQHLQQKLTAALAQLAAVSQRPTTTLDRADFAPLKATDDTDQRADIADASLPSTAPSTAVEPALHSAEQTLQSLRSTIQEYEAYRDLARDEHHQLLAACEKLVHDHEYLKAENTRLEEYHYRLMDDQQLVDRSDRLEQENQELQQTISHLQADCEQYQHRLQAQHNHEANLRRIDIVSPCHHQGGQQADLFHVELDLNFNRVVDALEFAEYLFPDILDIWETARDSACISNYKSPGSAYTNLQALAWFGRDYFKQDGQLGMGMRDYLQQLSCDYSSESDSVKNNAKLRGLRNFRKGNTLKIMYDHLKLGTRGGDGSLRIYFAINAETQKIEIGYCGRHLPVKSS